MSGYWWWLILELITGNPLLALVILVVAALVLDRFTLGIFPGPLRALRRWRRAGQLERELAINPHNRRSRFELAELYLGQRRSAKALAVLGPNLAAGDDDVGTLYLMGRAAYGSGHAREAEVFLGSALEREPDYRLGAIFLELGRGRLAQRDFTGARAALEQVCKRREGAVEARVLLARACTGLGEGAEASALRRAAWSNYATSPRFIQRQERWWAWRIKPWRPALVAAVILALAFGVLTQLHELGASPAHGAALGPAMNALPTAPEVSREAER